MDLLRFNGNKYRFTGCLSCSSMEILRSPKLIWTQKCSFRGKSTGCKTVKDHPEHFVNNLGLTQCFGQNFHHFARVLWVFCISSLVSPESTFLPLHAPVPYSAPHERTAPCGDSVHVLSAPALEMPRTAATSAIFIIKGNSSSE